MGTGAFSVHIGISYGPILFPLQKKLNCLTVAGQFKFHYPFNEDAFPVVLSDLMSSFIAFHLH